MALRAAATCERSGAGLWPIGRHSARARQLRKPTTSFRCGHRLGSSVVSDRTIFGPFSQIPMEIGSIWRVDAAMKTFNEHKRSIPPAALPRGMNDHKLQGPLKDFRECHLDGDALLSPAGLSSFSESAHTMTLKAQRARLWRQRSRRSSPPPLIDLSSAFAFPSDGPCDRD
jgi:hypothetical protein